MKAPSLAAVLLATTLAACGGAESGAPDVEPTATGAIVYATGVAARQGAFAARLTAANDGAEPDEYGVLSLSFRVTYPRYATNQGSEFSRTVHEAFSLTNLELQRVRTIRVTAAQNTRETRRRR